MTKILRIDDYIHAQLKKEAESEGRTLQWWAEHKLTSSVRSEEQRQNEFVESLPRYEKFLDSGRTTPVTQKEEIRKQISALEAEIAQVDPDTQDPDIIQDMSEKVHKVKLLWDKWHKL